MKTYLKILSLLTFLFTFSGDVLSQTNTTIKSKPNLNRIRTELVGRKISDQKNGYQAQNWYWEIKNKEEIKKVKIFKIEQHAKDYIVYAELTMQSEYSNYIAVVKIGYHFLKQKWILGTIDTKEFNIVKTGRYDNCISVSTHYWTYVFTNSCDVPLLVGGAVYSEYDNTWEKFTKLVKPNNQVNLGNMFTDYKDCKIHFIERP